MPFAPCDCHSDCGRTEVDRRKDVAHLAWVIAAICTIAQTKLSPDVPPPALGAPVAQQSTGMKRAGRDGDGGLARAEVDRGQVVAHLAGVIAAIVRVSQTELALQVS